MGINNLNILDIENNEDINTKFLSTHLEKFSSNCKIYTGDFYLDSFNYFPITKDNFSFLDIFSWKEKSEYNHFFTKKFYSNFEKNKKNAKVFNDLIVLGTSPGDNYFRNLLTFIPRILFIPDKKINLAIHRNSSNKLREFIKKVLHDRGIELKKFIYLDDNFYKFENSKIPQFLSQRICVQILNKVFKKNHKNKNKIYLTRKNANYRKIINESDLIDEFKSKNFQIIDLETLSIDKQIDVFSSAETIVSPTSSSLANIVFCNEGTKVFEIKPKYQYPYENNLKSRYSFLCSLLGCKHYSMEADPVKIDNIDEITKKYIDKNVINQSNYYKNLLVKKNDFIKFIN